MEIREYFILGSIGILCVFSLAIGVEKMLKIILGNYLLTALCLTLPTTIGALMGWLSVVAPDVGQIISPFFENRIIVTLVVYLLMLLLLFLKSRISIHFHVGGVQRFFLTLIGVPLTIVSVATTLQIAVLGLQVFDMSALQIMADSLPIHGIYKIFIANTPIIICIHAFLTVFILSHINWIPKAPSFSFKKKSSDDLPDITIQD